MADAPGPPLTAPPRRWWPGSLSIQYKLPLLICALLLGVVLMSSWAAYRGVRGSAFAAARERLENVSNQLASLLQASAGQVGAAVAKAAANDTIRRFLETPNETTRLDAISMMRHMGPVQEQVVSVELWSPERKQLLTAAAQAATDSAGGEPETVQWAVRADTGLVGQLQLGGDSLIYPVTALVLGHGGPLGYVVQWRRASSNAKSREGTIQLIGSGAGLYVGGDRGDFWTDLVGQAEKPPVDVRHARGIMAYDRPGTGRVMATARSLAPLPWVVLLEFPESVVAAPATRFIRRLILIDLAIVAVGLLLAWGIGRRIARPLRELTVASAEVAAGDFSRHVTTTRTDELGRLAAAFNSMATQVHGAQTRLEDQVRERTSTLEERNEELEAFAYSISHDLRAPLRTMQGFSEALLEDFGDKLDPAGRDYAERIVAGSRRMDELIRDLLAYSRVSRSELQLMPVALRPLADTAVAELETALRARAGTVRVADSLPVVHGHPGTLSQVFANLLGNALKFVPENRPPVIEISTDRRNGMVRVWVIDNGIGIASEHRDRIFRVFERLHSTEEYPGTGIGLAIVRKAIERMGGKVGVDSTPGQGSRFWIELQPVDERAPA
jgi:signal transduction histidine kinase